MAPDRSVQRGAGFESAASERSRAVGRVLAVLEELSVAAGPLSNNDLAVRLGVPAASMYRLLQKLAGLGYVEYSQSHASYGVGARLAELGERLADAGCRSPPLRRLMSSLRSETGDTVSVWVRSGVHVRLAALLLGEIRGLTSVAPGEIAMPFSTPGLAIASQYKRDQVRALVTQCRRRRVGLGRRFNGIAEVEQALRDVRSRGFVAGYNLRADGWGMLAWPIPVTTSPLRIGALALGAPVAALRRDEDRILDLASRLMAEYLRDQAAHGASGDV
ncbi:MAG: helix-turn-helix domain-containing protein [Steroidobacteraceae bacterium]